MVGLSPDFLSSSLALANSCVPASRDAHAVLLTPCSRKMRVARLYRPTYATANMGIRHFCLI